MPVLNGLNVIQKIFLLFLVVWTTPSLSFGADDIGHSATLNMMGELGLNTVPSARLSPEGTLRVTLSRQAPYTHAAMGLQISDRLYVGLRQTSESDSFSSSSKHLYPGMDIKLGLFDERRFLPQISVGLQSAFGHKRMAAEYLAMSKRYEDFDFTLGFGWGRLATRGGLPNPILLNHIMGTKSARDIDGDDPNTPNDWFKGDMGIFGGFEYHTPIDGLSFKADITSDSWKAEKAADPQFNAPALWSVGLSYTPSYLNGIDTGIAYAGNNSVMARVSFTPHVGSWPFNDARQHASIDMKSGRPNIINPPIDSENDEDDDFNQSLEQEKKLGLSHILIDKRTAAADLDLKDNFSTPFQIGESSRYLANIAGRTPEQIIFHIRRYGLKGTDIELNRADLERAFLNHQGSSEEIWQTTQFLQKSVPPSLAKVIGDIQTAQEDFGFKTDLINDVSLSENDSGLLYRTGIIASLHKFFGRHFFSLHSLRINLADNLQNLNLYRGLNSLPVRSDIDAFTQNRVVLDRSFLTGFVTLGDDLHMASSIGYLEEMYMGATSEIIYRPFGNNWALGAEANLALKRDPYSSFALLPNGDHILSGFLNGYYEIPNTGATLKASIGRYLAGDIGGSLALSNEFENGVIMKADITATNQSNPDIYGGTTNVYSGIRLSLPLGSLPFVPNGSRIVTNAAPLGRDKGQRLDNPTPLYEMTEPLSYRHITRQWQRLMPSP